MDKILTVLKSEYLRRVKSKGFIITTLVLPFGIVLLITLVALLSSSALNDDEESYTIAVVDETEVLFDALERLGEEGLQFVRAPETGDALRAAVIEETYSGYLHLPAGLLSDDERPSYYAPESGSSLERRLERRLEQVIEARRLAEQNISAKVLELLNANVRLRMVKLTEEGEDAGFTEIFIALGFFMGFLIFMMMVIYGQVVMQGVIDEKMNRVVEIVVSSVKPFQLMMGKVLGIGLMGLTQIAAWTALIWGASFAITPILLLFLDRDSLGIAEGTDADLSTIAEAAGVTLPTVSPDIFVWFVIYFLLGYLLFASIYAAIGSLVESQQDAQSYLLPVMIPIILAMYTIVPQVQAPNSTLAVSMSMIPLTSPISMVVRNAVTDVPLWELLVSVTLLVGTFLGMVWVGSRIYRIGILMHGKKPSPGELMKWIRYS